MYIYFWKLVIIIYRYIPYYWLCNYYWLILGRPYFSMEWTSYDETNILIACMKICLEFPTWKEMLFFFIIVFMFMLQKIWNRIGTLVWQIAFVLFFFHHKEAIKMNWYHMNSWFLNRNQSFSWITSCKNMVFSL